MKHHRFTELWPMLEDAELIALKEDIAKFGLRHPILTYKGEVLDGRNRYRACEALGYEPQCVEANVANDDEALDLVLSLNEHRRHLTTAQRAFAAEKLATLRHGGARNFKSSFDLLKTTETKSLHDAAKRMGVSVGSAKRARDTRTHGTEADIAEVLSGKVSLTAKAEQLRAKARAAKKAPPPKSEPPRVVFSSAGPLRELAKEQVEPGFSGTHHEFIDKYGHHQSSTAAERSRSVLIAWTGAMRSLLKSAKSATWPSDLPHWVEFLDEATPYEVDKLAEAVEYLRPKLAFAEALLARAQAVAVAKKRA